MRLFLERQTRPAVLPVAVLLSLSVACFARVAGAQDSAAVQLRIQCADAEEIQRLVNIELAALEAEREEAQRSGFTLAEVTCTGANATISVSGSASTPLSTTVRRPIAASSRALALSITELIAASWVERRARRKPPQDPDPRAEQPTPPSEVNRPTTRQANVGLGASFTSFPNAPIRLAGGVLTAQLPVHRDWGLALDTRAEAGTVAVDTGDVSVQLMSLAVGPFVGLQGESIAGSAGVAARFGFAKLAGQSRQSAFRGESTVGLWWSPVFRLGARAEIYGPVFLRLNFEVGYVARSVAGTTDDSAVTLAVDDAFLNATAAFGVLL